jgi:hypothetical protein
MPHLPGEGPPDGAAFAIGEVALVPVTIVPCRPDDPREHAGHGYLQISAGIPAGRMWISAADLAGQAHLRVTIRDFCFRRMFTQVESGIAGLRTLFWVLSSQLIRVKTVRPAPGKPSSV